MQTEREKMIGGLLYKSDDPSLLARRRVARELVKSFNDSAPNEEIERRELLSQLFHTMGERVVIEPPFHCDYGDNIRIGNDFFANFGCVFLDCAEITIGNNVMMASYVQLYAAYHPLDATTRNSGLELASPIKIGNSVWIGGGVIILPGVEIGDEAVIGAGSVVTKNMPPRVVAVGNPCRVIKQL